MDTLPNRPLVGVILCLPSIPDSISYRPYLEKIGSKTLLECLIKKFQSDNPLPHLYILTPNDTEVEDILIDISGKFEKVSIVKIQGTQLQSLIHLCGQIKSSIIAVVSLGFIFAPCDLLDRAVTHHLEKNNSYTYVIGLPRGSDPEVYNTEILGLLREVAFPVAPSTLREALEHILLASTAGDQHRPNVLLRTLLAALKLLTKTKLAPFRTVPFDALRAYSIEEEKLPADITINDASDAETARQMFQGRLSEAFPYNRKSDTENLSLWKQIKQGQQDLQIRGVLKKINIQSKSSKPFDVARILYISNASAFSGGEESLCQLIANLDSNKYEKHALIGQEGFFVERLQQAGAKVVSPNQDFQKGSIDNFIYLLSVLKDIQPDIIHFNCRPGMPALAASAFLDIPVIQHLRVPKFEGTYIESMKIAQAIIAVSNFVKHAASKHEVVSEKIHVVYNGINTDYFKPGSFNKLGVRRELNLPLDAKIALMVARFVENKRHDMLIKASEVVKNSLGHFHLVLVGDSIESPSYFDSIKKQISSAGLESCVSILDFQKDIRKVETAADIIVLCSDIEPLPRSILEAMAMKIPVIVTDSDGKQEVVQNNVNGYVVPSGDYMALSVKMNLLLSNSNHATIFAEAARKTIEQKFHIGRHVQGVEEIYKQILGARYSNFQLSG